ncbi:MAG: hypothetical protein IPP74_00425 [Alphaproteobacteria bacterium]|nr:hypothetical protein [Alphaproteobacteria bacterium]
MRSQKNKSGLLMGGVFLVSASLAAVAMAQTTLSIESHDGSQNQDIVPDPGAVVFCGNKYNANISLKNHSGQDKIFKIDIVDAHPLENGLFEVVEQPLNPATQNVITSHVVVYPRMVKLKSNEKKDIRVLLRGVAGPASMREDRAYIVLREVEDGDNGVIFNDKDVSSSHSEKKSSHVAKNADALADAVRSVPVLLRPKKAFSKIDLTNVVIAKEKKGLNLDIKRSGDFSVLGSLSVTYIPSDSSLKQIDLVTVPANVFAPLEQRHMEIKWDAPQQIDLKKGKLQVNYNSEYGRKTKLLDSETVGF